MEQNSCDPQTCAKSTTPPFATPLAHFAFRTLRCADVPPCVVELPLCPPLGARCRSHATGLHTRKNALATSIDIKQHTSRNELANSFGEDQPRPNMMFPTNAFRTSSTVKNHATNQTMYDFRAQSLLVNFTSARLQHQTGRGACEDCDSRMMGCAENPRTR